MNSGVSAIVAKFASGLENGTCWFAESDRLVTAGHVVLQDKKLAKQVTVFSSTGGTTFFKQKQITVFPGYLAALNNISEKPADNDVAVLRGGMVPGGQALPVQITVPTALRGRPLQVCGFPNKSGPMECAAGTGDVALGHQRLVTYPVGTVGGHSGSPVTVAGSAGVVAIHVAGGHGSGFAMAIDSEIAHFIRSA